MSTLASTLAAKMTPATLSGVIPVLKLRMASPAGLQTNPTTYRSVVAPSIPQPPLPSAGLALVGMILRVPPNRRPSVRRILLSQMEYFKKNAVPANLKKIALDYLQLNLKVYVVNKNRNRFGKQRNTETVRNVFLLKTVQ